MLKELAKSIMKNILPSYKLKIIKQTLEERQLRIYLQYNKIKHKNMEFK